MYFVIRKGIRPLENRFEEKSLIISKKSRLNSFWTLKATLLAGLPSFSKKMLQAIPQQVEAFHQNLPINPCSIAYSFLFLALD